MWSVRMIVPNDEPVHYGVFQAKNIRQLVKMLKERGAPQDIYYEADDETVLTYMIYSRIQPNFALIAMKYN